MDGAQGASECMNQGRGDRITIADVIERDAELTVLAERFVIHRDLGALDTLVDGLELQSIDAGYGDVLLRAATLPNAFGAVLCYLVALGLGLLLAVPALFEGVFFNESLDLDLARDRAFWIAFVLGLPMLVFIVGRFALLLPQVVVELCMSGVISITRLEFNEFSGRAQRLFAHRAVIYAPATVAGLMVLVAAYWYVLGPGETWHAHRLCPRGTIAGWSSLVPAFLMWYFITLGVVRIAISCWLLLRLLHKYPPKIQPFHPDGCGGLYPLGRLFMRLNFAVCACGLLGVASIVNNVNNLQIDLWHPFNIGIAFVYVTAALAVFLIPSYAAHRRMFAERRRALRIVNQRLDLLNRGILDALAARERLEGERVELLERRYNRISLMAGRKKAAYSRDLKTKVPSRPRWAEEYAGVGE